MAISLDKILSISLSEYREYFFETLGKESWDYELKGVHFHGGLVGEFAQQVPEDAVVVVSYNHINDKHHYGVALIPKTKKA